MLFSLSDECVRRPRLRWQNDVATCRGKKVADDLPPPLVPFMYVPEYRHVVGLLRRVLAQAICRNLLSLQWGPSPSGGAHNV